MTKNELKILETTKRMFILQGIRNSSLEEIARGSGTTDHIVLTLFPSKERLVNGVIDYLLSDHRRSLSVITLHAPNAVIALNRFFDLIERHVAILTPAIVAELRSFYPASIQRITDSRNTRLCNALDENFLRGQKEHLFRADLDPSKFRGAYLHALSQIVRHHDSMHTSLQQLVATLNSLFLKGALTPAGVFCITSTRQVPLWKRSL